MKLSLENRRGNGEGRGGGFRSAGNDRPFACCSRLSRQHVNLLPAILAARFLQRILSLPCVNPLPAKSNPVLIEKLFRTAFTPCNPSPRFIFWAIQVFPEDKNSKANDARKGQTQEANAITDKVVAVVCRKLLARIHRQSRCGKSLCHVVVVVSKAAGSALGRSTHPWPSEDLSVGGIE